MARSAGSYEQRMRAVDAAVRDSTKRSATPSSSEAPVSAYIEEHHEDHVVVRDYVRNQFWRVPYTVDGGGVVTLGEWTEVQQAYATVTKELRLLVPIEKAAAARRITYGVVLEPDTEDLQGDVMEAEDIELSAHSWMEESQAGGQMHAEIVKGACVVESFLAPADFEVETDLGTETVRKGSWVLAMRWPEDIWKRIEDGELTGYSVGGQGVRLDVEDEVVKHGSGDQSPHGKRTRHGRSEDSGRTHTTRDGEKLEEKMKVKRTDGGSRLVGSNGVEVDLRNSMFANGQKAPKLTEGASWAVHPMMGGRADRTTEKIIWSKANTTLADFMASLPPGEYELAT